MALGLPWKPEGSLALSFCCSSSKLNMLTSIYGMLAFCLQVNVHCWLPMTVLWVGPAKEHLLKVKWIEAYDLAEGTRTQCSTCIVTQSIAPAQERQSVPAFLFVRKKWLKNWNCCPNLSLTQIQQMKLLKKRLFLSPESFTVRLSSKRGEEHHQCVNWPAAGIGSPRFPQATFRVSNGHSREDSKIGAMAGELKEEPIFQSIFKILY